MNVIRHNYPSPIQCVRLFPTGPCYVTLLLLLSPLLLLPLLLLLSHYFAVDTKSFRCGWIDNSTANTREYSLASPCVESTNLGWILYPRKLLRSPILVGYQDLFLAPLPGKHNYILWVTWDLRLLVTMRNLIDPRTKVLPSTTRTCKELPSSSALDSPSVMSKFVTPPPARNLDM